MCQQNTLVCMFQTRLWILINVFECVPL
uniref:Uncharacterized protein n=1 Tax=Anguilla anguilla TaxID=7936 RepID=A0A0E9XXE8_ANGAN